MKAIATFRVNQAKSYEINYQEIAGTKYLIAPVTIMTEGVHTGSSGSVLHKGDILKNSVDQWNGIPTIPYHPSNNGQYVSVNALSQAKNDINGKLFNVHFDEESNNLNADAWLDVSKLENKTPELLQALEAGQEVNVSVGEGGDIVQESGEFNGEGYIGYNDNYRPDHLAILMNENGACSLEDGCGIRGYSEDSPTFIYEKTRDDIKKEITVNKEYREFIRLVDSVVEGMYENAYTWIVEIYDDYFVYEYDPRGAEQRKYLRQMYTYSDTDKEVTLVGDPVEVVKNVSYEIKANSQQKEPENIKTNTQNKGGSEMGCECTEEKKAKVDKLINANTGFGEDDREMLEGLSDKVIDNMTANAVQEEPTKEEPKTETKQTQEAPTSPEKTIVTKEDVITAMKSMSNEELYGTVFSEEDQKAIKRGLKGYEDSRQAYISKLKDRDNVKNAYSEEQLKSFDLEKLEEIATLVGEDKHDNITSYLGVGGPTSTVATGGPEKEGREAMILPSDNFEKKEDK